MDHNPATPADTTEYQPLYAQVKTLLVQRIGSGAWKPGEMLPSEFQLAAEYKVSQGTVRKALLTLEADRLIVRRQGKGTYVARHSRQETLFHFFRMVGLDGQRRIPTSVVLTQRTQRATKEQASRLALELGAMLHAIVRVRSFEGRPAIFERIYVPVKLMPDLTVKPGVEMTDEMYVTYQEQYDTTIARATERLAAVRATAEEARHLNLDAGAPLLEILRVARDVNGKPVELRISRCDTSSTRYAVEVD
jgi:GntR family transcriptional regulator